MYKNLHVAADSFVKKFTLTSETRYHRKYLETALMCIWIIEEQPKDKKLSQYLAHRQWNTIPITVPTTVLWNVLIKFKTSPFPT